MSVTAVVEILRAGFEWAWRTSLEASVLIALVFLVQWLAGKRLPARVGYALWLLVLVRLVVPAVPESRMSIFNLQPGLAAIELKPIIAPQASVPPVPTADTKTTTLIPTIPQQNVPEPQAVASPLQSADLAAGFGWHDMTALVWPGGALGLIGLAVLFHFRTRRRLRQEQPISDPRVAALVEECRSQLGLRAGVPVLSAEFLRTPAVFGWWQARILLPSAMAARLETRELRMVLLHELVHIQRRDVLMNWLVIGVRALHWFNPLVWLAVKWLRAERELICDRRVLSLLTGEEERRCYGETLLKLLSGFSRPALNPSLVPLLTNKQTLKRRITMIAKYRPASRVAVVSAGALLALLCCLTFTRAAGQPGNGSAKAGEEPSSAELAKRADELRNRGIRRLENELEEHKAKIQAQEKAVSLLREKLHVTDLEMVEMGSGRSSASDRIAALERAETEASTSLIRENTVLGQLQNLSREQLRHSILVLHPDPVLEKLMQDHANAEANLLSLTNDYGPMASQVKNVQVQISYLNKRIDEGVDGIMRGLQLKVTSHRLLKEAIAKQIDEVKSRTAKLAPSLSEFFRAKRDFESLVRFGDALALKIAQEKVDSALPQSGESGLVYILGQVRNQGMLAMPPKGDAFTVAKVIAQAGGFLDLANKKKVKLIRTKPDGTRQDFELNIEALLQQGRAGQDVPLQSGDFIFVPERINNL